MRIFNWGLFAALLLIGGQVSAATIFSDDFEDGNADGWNASSFGTGTTGVVGNNGSLQAFSSTSFLGQRSLAKTFLYVSSDTLSFDMQINAHSGIELTVGGARLRNASGGVKITFLNTFNGALGVPVFFTYRTDGVTPPAYAGVFQGQTLNSFSALMTEYAALAGLGVANPIAKISLEFFANSEGGGGGTGSSVAGATVWFDNVRIASASVVPAPGAGWLLTVALGTIGVMQRTTKRRQVG